MFLRCVNNSPVTAHFRFVDTGAVGIKTKAFKFRNRATSATRPVRPDHPLSHQICFTSHKLKIRHISQLVPLYLCALMPECLNGWMLECLKFAKVQ